MFKIRKKLFYFLNRNKKKSFNEILMINWTNAVCKCFYTEEKTDQFKNLKNDEEENR